MGLDNQFGVIKTQILAMKPTPNLGAAYHLVTEDEQQRAIATTKRPVQDVAAFQTSYQARREGNRNQQHEKGWAKTGKNSLNDKVEHCDHCGRDGHNKEGCFKIIGYPEWWPGKGKKDKPKPTAALAQVETEVGPCPIPGMTEEQYKSFLNLFGGKREESVMANMAGLEDGELDWSG
ncbi:hypothetical protein Hanom_Chr08g00758341 [Helianthus anomalus]